MKVSLPVPTIQREVDSFHSACIMSNIIPTLLYLSTASYWYWFPTRRKQTGDSVVPAQMWRCHKFVGTRAMRGVMRSSFWISTPQHRREEPVQEVFWAADTELSPFQGIYSEAYPGVLGTMWNNHCSYNLPGVHFPWKEQNSSSYGSIRGYLISQGHLSPSQNRFVSLWVFFFELNELFCY